MKKSLLIFLLFFALTTQAKFIQGTDIPLMDNFQISESESFSFDTPAGQIMTITATTTLSEKEIYKFYQESLTALGWQKTSPTAFKREQDVLNIKITPQKQNIQITIQLTFSNK